MHVKTLCLTAGAAVLAFSPTAFSSGYRIPEQSLNSTALASAYVANANYADAAYYNPANMSWLSPGLHMEGGVTYIHLPSIKYEDFRSPALNGKSDKENFLMPNVHVVSPDFNNFRLGFAIVFPAGLSKEWDDIFPRTFAHEFSMTAVEANPSLSYKLNDMLSMALGFRVAYSEATVKSDGSIVAVPPGGLGGGLPAAPELVYVSRDMEGDTTEYGYNLALSFKPTEKLTLAATYRSKIDLDLEGTGTVSASGSFPGGLFPPGLYRGSGAVTVPIPAVLALAASYDFGRSTVEFAYDRTFWSTYDRLDFSYPTSLGHPVLTAAFDDPIVKDWDDVDAFRLGYTYRWDDRLTLMGGFGIDGNPVPDASLSFDLPDSDAWFVSLGFRYDWREQWSFGAAYLYADKEDRTVHNNALAGEFSGGASHLLSLSAGYAF
ncbi:MAG: outer membrane protein transport protein [Desulfobulbaceae bacterium]|nr:outer membrane protein transport protein [Desulfobulbaceae bacterium]